MKAKFLPSPGAVLAFIALVVVLGGTAYAVNSRDLGPLKLRSGKVIDRDTTAGDGVFNPAFGHAECKRGEQLISGGVRARNLPPSGSLRIALRDSGPVPKKRQWFASWQSDEGGQARANFVVFAYCLVR
jgi:hypothetical protein